MIPREPDVNSMSTRLAGATIPVAVQAGPVAVQAGERQLHSRCDASHKICETQFTKWERWSFRCARAKLAAQVATGFVRLSSFLVEPGTAVFGSIASPAHKGGCARPESARFAAATSAEEGVSMATLYSNNIVKRHLFGEAVSYPIRKIGLSDLREVLRLGWEDFQAMPSHAVVVCLIYPVLGLVLFRMVLGHSVLPLLFPLAAGFALIGPFAAIGLYELSRRRERGEEVEAWDAIKVLRAPSFGAMLELGVLLLVLFGVWIGVANAIYVAIFGHAAAASIPDFATRVLTTPEGWSLIIVGCGVGFLFAVAALCVSVVSFPLMLDRHATAIDAIRASLRVVAANPVAMAGWGLVVAALLVIGSLPLFVGLAVVLPVLGHATWHLYRRVVEPNPNPPDEPPPPPKGRRYAADFPANLFPWSREGEP
jgi:uncharacterized membrane protein